MPKTSGSSVGDIELFNQLPISLHHWQENELGNTRARFYRKIFFGAIPA